MSNFSFKQSLLRSSTIFSGLTLISRVLGYLRDMIAAHYFGAGFEFDAFLVAFKIPNFLRRLFAEGAFSQAFVPILAEYKARDNPQALKVFVNKVFTALAISSGLCCCLGVYYSTQVVEVFAPGFGLDQTNLASHLLKITFFYLWFIALTAFSAGILNTFNYFAASAFSPVFLNLSMIACNVLLLNRLKLPIDALAYGVVLGGMVQLGFNLLCLHKIKFWPKIDYYCLDNSVKRLLKLMLPALLGVSVNQLNILIDASFASSIGLGSVSWLYYSERLMEFPLGVFGVAISTVLLPQLAIAKAKQSNADFKNLILWGIKMVLLLGPAAAIGLAFLAEPLLILLFKSGRFVTNDVNMSAASLRAYTLGIPAFMLVRVLAASFYAVQNIKTPVKVAIVILILHLGLNFLLINIYAHAGLALSTSLAAIVHAGILYSLLVKQGVVKTFALDLKFLLKLSFANVSLIAILVYNYLPSQNYLTMTRSQVLLKVSVSVLLGIGTFILSLKILKLDLKFIKIRNL